MRAAICIKQVPMLIDLRFDVEAGRVVRDGVRLQSNPLDNIAVRTTVDALSRVPGAETVAVSMGPPPSEAVVRHAIGLGADRGVLVCDPALAGSDTLATARVLAATVRRLDASLAVLGRHSIDAETGQTGAMVAGLLGWPVVSAVRSFEIVAGALRAERDTDDGIQRVEVALPAVVTVAESAGQEAWPSKEGRERAAAAAVETWDIASLMLDPAAVGSAGSPTSVGAVRVVTSHRAGVMLDGDPVAMVESLCAALARTPPAVRSTTPRRRSQVREPGAGIWAVAEAGANGMRRVSQELVGAAAQLAESLGGQAVAVALGADATENLSEAGEWGADAGIAVPSAGTARDDTGVAASALSVLIADRAPAVVLLPSTTWGREVAGLMCAQSDLGLTGDAIGFEVRDGEVLALKPALGGALLAPIASSTVPVVATVRSGALDAPAVESGHCRVEVLSPKLPVARVRETSFTLDDTHAADLTWASTVFCAGWGVGRDGISLVERCAGVAGAAVASTRRVCEEGWLPRRLQVGLTGHSISPQLYVAAGVRGAFEHLAGIRGAGTVVAINTDAEAPIFEACDFGLLGDVRTILPILAERLAALPSAQHTIVLHASHAHRTEESS